jgi:hypothetical protein
MIQTLMLSSKEGNRRAHGSSQNDDTKPTSPNRAHTRKRINLPTSHSLEHLQARLRLQASSCQHLLKDTQITEKNARTENGSSVALGVATLNGR